MNFWLFVNMKFYPSKGKISKQMAAAKAEAEYAEFNKTQKITSDFDREVERLMRKGGNADE
jgi:hypothetical protein